MAGNGGEIAVIGSGVVGLTAALTLRGRGAEVAVYADRERAPAASLVAPALFTPYAGPDEARFRRWTEYAYRELARIAAEHGEASGVRMGELREYLYKRGEKRAWLDALMHTRPIRPVPGAFADATASVRPHLDMLRYMPWLEARAREMGVRFVHRVVGSFDELFALGHRVVVNSAGVGAGRLADDALLKPMHGQVVHVPNDIGLTYSLHDDAGGPGGQVAYIFVLGDRLVLGGTFDAGRDDQRTERGTLDAIVERCRQLLRMDGHRRWSELGRREVRALAGVRPTRGPEGEYEHTRVEREERGGGVVVHCYAHGRSGATLSWASAADVAELAMR